MQPGLGQSEIAGDGVDVHAEDCRDLVVGQPAEVVKLDRPRLALVEASQRVKRSIELDEGVRPCVGGQVVVQGDRPIAAASLVGGASPGVIDQDLAHQPCGNREEVRAVPYIEVRAGEADVGFADEVGRSERVAGALAPQAAVGEPAQLGVDQRDQVIERTAIAGAPVPQ